MNPVVKIQKGYWRAAGNIFGWKSSGLHVFGVGINMRVLQSSPFVDVIVEGEEYVLNCKDAMEFIRRYNTTKIVNMAKLGVVSKSLLVKKTLQD